MFSGGSDGAAGLVDAEGGAAGVGGRGEGVVECAVMCAFALGGGEGGGGREGEEGNV